MDDKQDVVLNIDVEDDIGNFFNADITINIKELNTLLAKKGYCIVKKRKEK